MLEVDDDRPRVGVEDQDALDDGAAIHEPPPPLLPARIRRARPCVFVAHELVVLASCCIADVSRTQTSRPLPVWDR